MMGEHRPRPTVAFDVDGTLFEDIDRQPELGAPRPALVALARDLEARGWDVVAHTGRDQVPGHVPQELWDTLLEWWLGKEPGDVWVDDRALPALENCWEALEELLQLALEHPRRLPRADRAVDAYRVWSNEAVTNFRLRLRHVSSNPAAPADTQGTLRVAVPFTGGLDSLTAYHMARVQGLAPRTHYVDAGQPYADAELATVGHLLGGNPDVIHVLKPGELTRYGYTEVGRNPAYVLAVAYGMGGPGELWLGNRGDEGRWQGGDKSVRFHLTMQQMLTLMDVDVRIVNPLAGMDKRDCVWWLVDHGLLEQAIASRTCFEVGDRRHCGRCWACLQRALAFTGADLFKVWARDQGRYDFDMPVAELRARVIKRKANGQRVGFPTWVGPALRQLGYLEAANELA